MQYLHKLDETVPEQVVVKALIFKKSLHINRIILCRNSLFTSLFVCLWACVCVCVNFLDSDVTYVYSLRFVDNVMVL